MTELATVTLADGSEDIHGAAADLALRLPAPLEPLARLAYNYLWSWWPGGDDVFRMIDSARWEASNHNPIRLLHETTSVALERAAGDAALLERIATLLAALDLELARPPMEGRATPARPVAFLCAEFAVHRSLPIYAGGLGVLAGDILKQASDMALPLVGVGLLYRQGDFQQRMDKSGYQHEYWLQVDPERVPAALVTNGDAPLTVTIPLRQRDVVVQVWRLDIGRTPLYLLDAQRPENSPIDQWITSRLYVADRPTRLAQYALLGIGSMRALDAMGIDPCVVHLNEGHGALAPLEMARREMANGRSRHEAFTAARERTVFTTHTPVSAGNEGYDVSEIVEVLGDYPDQVGLDLDGFLHLGRTRPDNPHEQFVMTPLGIKMSRARNGVSRRHGEVARQMWQSLFPERPADTVPIGHVTNGVHVPTWMAPRMRDLLDGYLGAGWESNAADPATWHGVDVIPDAELWDLRNALRADFVQRVREHSIASRLARDEPRWYVEAAEHGFDEHALTFGFARRLAGYKRIQLLTHDPQRAEAMLENNERPVQIILAGKAHPQDEEGKHAAQGLFGFRRDMAEASRLSFLDNYSLATAMDMVAGCDVWINVPRPPLEASGTSGMKAAINGGLNLSVLDGWWAEAYDGTNGWAIPGDILFDHAMQDSRDASTLFDIIEHEIIPLFYQRDEHGIPRGWVERIRASLRTNGPRYSAARMLHEYAVDMYGLIPAR